MHRRPLGRGRLLAAVAAIILAVGCLLPWWQLGGEDLPSIGSNAFGGAGIVVFLVAAATLAIITLPYAMDRSVGIDRWSTYALLTLAAVVALGVAVVDLVTSGAFSDGFLPDRAPGLWVTVLGLILLGRATYVIALERPRE